MKAVHSKRWGITAAAAAATVALVLSGCATDSGGAGSSDKIVINATWSFADSVGWVGEIVGATQRAKELGVEFNVVSAEGDSTKQASQMSTFITNGASAILISPVDDKAGSKLVEDANTAGIPIGTVDSHVTQGGDVIIESETDNYACGAGQATAMIELAGDSELKVLVVQGLKGSTAAVDREKGFLETIKGHDNIEVVASAYGAWSGDESQQAVLNAFQANPEINAIFNTSDVNTVGTIEALRQLDKLYPAGDPKHILMTSNDGFPFGLDFVRDGYVDANATQQILKMGADAVEALVAAVKNGTKPEKKENYIPPILVNKDNVDDAALWGNVMKDWQPSDGYDYDVRK